MKQFFINWRAQFLLRKNSKPRISTPYNEAREVGVIFSVEDIQKHESVKEFVAQLKLDSKEVSVLEFLPSNKENYEFKYDYFSINDFSIFGKNTSASVKKFNEKIFDFLIYLDNNPHPAMLQLLAESRARCRVGKYWESKKSFFEFMFDHSGHVSKLIEQINLYIRRLK